MLEKTTVNNLNTLLKPYGAVVTFKDSCRQSKEDNAIGCYFKNNKKPVYNFSVVSIKDGKSFANIYSDIYGKIPKEVKEVFLNSFIETKNRIYI